MSWNKFLIGVALVCPIAACGESSESGKDTTSSSGGTSIEPTGGGSTGSDSAGGSSAGGDSAGGSSAGGDSADGSSAGGDSAGGSSTGGDSAGGGVPGSGAEGGEGSGGGSDGGVPGSGGAVSPFDGYPDWVLTCFSGRSIANCGGCLDSKCVFCTYASLEEKETYNATREGIDQCGVANLQECSCQLTISGCPPCGNN